MAIKSLGAYDFPSRSRQELYGDDQLVSVWFQDTMWFAAPAMFRAPRAMTWADFRDQMFVPFAEEDPDYDPAAPRTWTLHGAPFEPRDDQTLAELGVRHKDVIGTRVAA
ncbi:phenol hydroxylase subunit P4 [Janibacter indicus]|uniref:Phenol 2-monooxygenase P4 subunit n=1 Tax=Janibacter indicus TaxID=857417 RepID=A0A1W2ARZ8_9MICO|nr:phenol hydroxylase subunit P4 [Janibacter indicus]SMC63487.1 phenol 2-monooxygenase P4 subunit [Janibacter indicus]